MTRLASLTVSCIVVALAVLPSGLAGPACAKKNYSQQQCIERCKAKWGYPGALMGGDRWGSVMRKVADTSTEAMDAAVSQACGVESSAANAHGAVATASSESTTTTSDYATPTLQSTIITTTSSSSSSTSTSSSATSSSSSFSVVANLIPTDLLSGLSAPATSSQTPTTTSTSSTPTSSSTTEESTPTSEPPPPPPPSTTKSSTPESTPTQDSGDKGDNDNGNNNGNSNQGSNQGSGNSNSGSSGSTSGSDIQAYLSAHNSVRAQHGAADLTWSDEAAGKAQEWANKCVFEHSGGALGPFGAIDGCLPTENLAAGTGSSYGISEAIKSWTDEVKDYNPGNPQASHFTQVVWKASTQVGCAVASCDGIFDASFGKAKFFVCEYTPQGNVIGAFAANVQA
ncbi:hypothetical protein V5O48_001711 [Marasmius crinis-equi]|uniref:SCP domain-containing protein n=1 Tax=Marasmius crinis-equi TaxID=585013 RepID=A0ABR3FY14_9AGAR